MIGNVLGQDRSDGLTVLRHHGAPEDRFGIRFRPGLRGPRVRETSFLGSQVVARSTRGCGTNNARPHFRPQARSLPDSGADCSMWQVTCPDTIVKRIQRFRCISANAIDRFRRSRPSLRAQAQPRSAVRRDPFELKEIHAKAFDDLLVTGAEVTIPQTVRSLRMANRSRTNRTLWVRKTTGMLVHCMSCE